MYSAKDGANSPPVVLLSSRSRSRRSSPNFPCGKCECARWKGSVRKGERLMSRGKEETGAEKAEGKRERGLRGRSGEAERGSRA